MADVEVLRRWTSFLLFKVVTLQAEGANKLSWEPAFRQLQFALFHIEESLRHKNSLPASRNNSFLCAHICLPAEEWKNSKVCVCLFIVTLYTRSFEKVLQWEIKKNCFVFGELLQKFCVRLPNLDASLRTSRIWPFQEL